MDITRTHPAFKMQPPRIGQKLQGPAATRPAEIPRTPLEAVLRLCSPPQAMWLAPEPVVPRPALPWLRFFAPRIHPNRERAVNTPNGCTIAGGLASLGTHGDIR